MVQPLIVDNRKLKNITIIGGLKRHMLFMFITKRYRKIKIDYKFNDILNISSVVLAFLPKMKVLSTVLQC